MKKGIDLYVYFLFLSFFVKIFYHFLLFLHKIKQKDFKHLETNPQPNPF